MDKIIIDAKDCVLGRLGVQISKLTRMNNAVVILNCEKIVISGSRKTLLNHYLARLHRGSTESGPRHPKRPDRFVRRAIRDMFNYKSTRGKANFAKVKIFMGVPDEYKDKISKDFKCKKSSDLMHNKFVVVEDLCKQLGGKW